VLAGTATGNQMRVEFAHKLLNAGVSAEQLVAVGALRPLSPVERADEPTALDAVDEWQHLSATVSAVFGLSSSDVQEDDADPPPSWQDVSATDRTGRTVRLICAPMIAGRRPNTATSLRFMLERLGVANASSMLLVTSAIYAPYTFFTAAPILLGAGVRWMEVVGTPTAQRRDPAHRAQRLLQEVKSTLDAIAGLNVAG
jgi:hypothetical protein